MTGRRADGDPLFAAQSRRPGLDAGGTARRGRVRAPARPDPRVGRDPPRPRAARGNGHIPMTLAAPEIVGPAGDDDGDDQDLQHRGRATSATSSSPTQSCARRSARGWRRWGSRPTASGCSWRRPPIRPRARPGSTRCMAYLDGNRRVFDAGVNAIPGVRSMPLEATYLRWVDFTGTGMDARRVHAPGRDGTRGSRPTTAPTFGAGGEALPAVQHRHAPRAGRGGRGAAPGGVRRPTVTTFL